MTANTTLEYRGYIALIELDDDGDCFHGRVMNTRDVINFYGRTPAELRAEFATSVDEYIAFCAERGVEPEKPYSGRLLVRLNPEVHRALAVKAARQHKSLSKLIRESLEGAAAPERALA
jgi:predicted HicB family RNase H-like nuclease